MYGSNKRSSAAALFVLLAAAGLRLQGEGLRPARQSRRLGTRVDRTRVPPPLKSTVPGLTLTGALRRQGAAEYLDVVLHNDTDVGIDAFEFSLPLPRPRGDLAATGQHLRQDARWGAGQGGRYKLRPDAPLVAPRGAYTISMSASAVPAGAKLVLSAAAFRDGRVVGANAKGLRYTRAEEAAENGLPEELRRLDPRRAAEVERELQRRRQ